jgi:YbgC/YbaW family acyl-CoA thioester hydrolase
MPYEFQITRCVEFSETDLAGIMHFSNFFRFMESAEHAFFRSLGFSAARSRFGVKVCLPRVHAECDYAVPLRFEDEVQVRLLVERKGRCSLTYQFRFSRLNGSSQQEVARGRLTAASVERQADGSLKPVPLPQAIADKIEQAPAHLLGREVPTRPQLSRRSSPSPSPQPSPSGRGRNLDSAGKLSPLRDHSQTVEACSLSPRERVRVRGNRAPDGLNAAKAASPSPLHGPRRERPKRPRRSPARNNHLSTTR